MYPDRQTEFKATAAITPDLEKLVTAATGGGQLVNHNWYSGNDQFFLSNKPLRTSEDFKGLKTRSHSTALSDWINGMGATAQFVAFAEVYSALERGILDAAVTGGDAAFGQRLYEVADYINGPLVSMPSTNNIINKDVWNKLKPDLQQILIEEGAKSELEALRIAAIQNEMGLLRSTTAGMKYVEFSPALKELSNSIALQRVIPAWIKRVGGGDKPIIKVFNEKVGPLVGLRIEATGALTKLGGQAPVAVAPAPASVAAPTALGSYAFQYAGKPGAIYVGDLQQLVGPAPAADLGDKSGGVPLESLQRHKWIYEGDYYKKLLVTAKLDNPTPLTTTAKSIKLQYACINRTLLPCKLMEAYFEPNVLKRTNGQVKIEHSSYPELGIAGPDTLRLVSDGTLSISEIYGGYVSGDLPVAEIFYFWGLYPSHEAEYRAQWDIIPAVDQFISKGAGGAKVITHNWYAGNDQYFFSRKPLRTLEDFKGAKVRSHGTTLTDWITGVGGDAQFVAFAEVYVALERGILDAGVSGATAGHGLRWYEVAKYLDGPFRSFPADFIIINKGAWDKLPPDIQQILIEEGAKQELEGLRLAAIQNEEGLSKNTDAGMEFVPFSPELQAYAYENSIIKRMIPNWVKRVGGADKPEVALFNQIIAPLAGVKINPDGSAIKVPITK
jgi:TRAP-type C4-dicarboxylate transport system substrate-binding protein